MPDAAISCDVDTLASIYKGHGLCRPDYTYAELHMGLENFCRFLEPLDIKATLFMVGQDFLPTKNVSSIRSAAAQGHEIANHTYTHAQGFRLMDAEEKEREIARMEDICEQVTGKRPLGFRSPGWNVSDDAVPILRRRGYRYDSSVFPCFLNPLLKALHWWSTRARCRADRTTLGHLRYMLAPTTPYRIQENRLGRPGNDDLLEFPVTVVPILRLPFFATFLLATGMEVFKACYGLLKSLNHPIQYQFHLSDFVDYNHPDLRQQVPKSDGVYVPQALNTPLNKKWEVFENALEQIARDYTFTTLEHWANRMLKDFP